MYELRRKDKTKREFSKIALGGIIKPKNKMNTEMKNAEIGPSIEPYIGVKLVQAFPEMKSSIVREGSGDVSKSEDGYAVIYENGYKSWSPKEVFEKAYRRTTGLTFGLAIEALKLGKCVARRGWNGKGMFIYKALPNSVPAEIVPKMISLSEDTKKLITTGLNFGSGMTIVKPDGTADSWVASSSDTFAEDWFIVE